MKLIFWYFCVVGRVGISVLIYLFGWRVIRSVVIKDVLGKSFEVISKIFGFKIIESI